MQIHSSNAVTQGAGELLQKSGLAIKLNKEQKPSQNKEVENPHRQDKLELTSSSLKEEIALVKSQEYKQQARKAALDDLEHRLLQIESVLYQVAATLSFDADSMEAIQKKIARELSGMQNIIGGVDLPGIEKVDLKLLAEESQKVKLDSSESVAKLRKDLGQATEAVKELKEQAELTGTSDGATGKRLEIAHQNTQAALSTYNPSDIVGQADNVARALKEQGGQAFAAHARLDYKSVINLVG